MTAIAAVPMIQAANESEVTSPLRFDDAERFQFDVTPMGTPTVGMQGNVLLTQDSLEDDMIPRITQDAAGNIGVVWTHTMG
ncbi:MAG: hypothetical protein ACP5FL_05315, partial [Thermoplasmatota archaeon]